MSIRPAWVVDGSCFADAGSETAPIRSIPVVVWSVGFRDAQFSAITWGMPAETSKSIYNVPNLLTSIRLVLAIAVIVLIPLAMYVPALIVFLVAVSTDWIDGYWARKYGQVTKLGRIFDPFVDKIIICGSFIALVEIRDSGVAAWMAIVVVARELLVTSLRGMIEGSGGDFSAKSLGKWKMVLQCAAVVAVLLVLIAQPAAPWLKWTSLGLLWAAVGLTVYSGYDYAWAAAKMMQDSPDASTPPKDGV